MGRLRGEKIGGEYKRDGWAYVLYLPSGVSYGREEEEEDERTNFSS